MLKKISVKQLLLGMHVKEFCGSWLESPFWRTSFVLNDPEDIKAILASSIKEVWIDSSQGVDVPLAKASVLEAETDAQVDALQDLTAAVEHETAPIPVSAEFARAAEICTQAKRAVASMFQEARLGKAVDTRYVRDLVEEISASIMRNPVALISLARLKTSGEYTYMHSVAVCALMIALARQLNLNAEQTRSAGVAGLLHDLGKAMMPPEILNKQGKLTDEDLIVMKTHPEEGRKLLLGCASVDDVTLDVVLHHHERTDGTGYPECLKGTEISLYAKMSAVCDVYDAITSNRPYKNGWNPAESLSKMSEWTKGHFAPDVFQAFVNCVGIYPIGSLVRLSSGRLGVVIDQSKESLEKPFVKVFYSTQSRTRIGEETIDLSSPHCPEEIIGSEDPAKWYFPDLAKLWSGLPNKSDRTEGKR